MEINIMHTHPHARTPTHTDFTTDLLHSCDELRRAFVHEGFKADNHGLDVVVCPVAVCVVDLWEERPQVGRY